MGQFATPNELAREMLQFARTQFHQSSVRFLDPALGTGSFYSALLWAFKDRTIASAAGYEIDPQYCYEVKRLWKEKPINMQLADFTKLSPPVEESSKPNLIICNPPYVRHHHLSREEKSRLQELVDSRTHTQLNGLTGLYGYFLLICHPWMAKGALAGWLIPSEFMDVNYGQGIRQYLLKCVKILRIHRFDTADVQFNDALVSSSIIWFRNEKPPENHIVEFSYGGTLRQPKVLKFVSVQDLKKEPKWIKLINSVSRVPSSIRLSDLFVIKRGLATGANAFFILNADKARQHKIPSQLLKPILPSPRFLQVDEIEADTKGNPVVEPKLFLLSVDLPEQEIKERYPSAWKYLQLGIKKSINKRYLCSHRSPWYSQENRPPAPFLCSYMGRKSNRHGKSFRFILNHSNATASNNFLMLYPQPSLKKILGANRALLKIVLRALQGISQDILREEGRVYGGGLHKLEPKELSRVPADAITDALSGFPDIGYVQTEL